MKSKVLIVALNENWTGISRLPYGLNRAGFETFALCPKKSFLAKTKYLKSAILYPTFTYSRSKLIYLWIIYSFFKVRPQLVLPGDEDSILALHAIAKLTKKMPYLRFISKVIRQSMAPEEFDSTVISKSEFQAKCNEWGIRTPHNIKVENQEQALEAAKKISYPLVVKHDCGYGGCGVFICDNERELLNTFKEHSLATVLKNFLKNKFFVTVMSSEKNISIQQYIDGRVGLTPFSSLNGKILAANSMLKIRTYPGKTGPTSVAEGYNNEELKKFAQIVAEKLRLTGFNSLDYIVDAKSGLPYVIELNPRPTPSCHIDSTVIVNDLCECLYRGLNNEQITLNEFRAYTIAMYPGEKKRDPHSEFLTSAYHDVPKNDLKLYAALEATI